MLLSAAAHDHQKRSRKAHQALPGVRLTWFLRWWWKASCRTGARSGYRSTTVMRSFTSMVHMVQGATARKVEGLHAIHVTIPNPRMNAIRLSSCTCNGTCKTAYKHGLVCCTVLCSVYIACLCKMTDTPFDASVEAMLVPCEPMACETCHNA